MKTRFTKGTRYYTLHCQRDLFDWVVVKAYGRIDTKLGQIKTMCFESEADALAYFDAECARRIKRSYA
jgi:predicted DNA-binding WGR domain protein